MTNEIINLKHYFCFDSFRHLDSSERYQTRSSAFHPTFKPQPQTQKQSKAKHKFTRSRIIVFLPTSQSPKCPTPAAPSRICNPSQHKGEQKNPYHSLRQTEGPGYTRRRQRGSFRVSMVTVFLSPLFLLPYPSLHPSPAPFSLPLSLFSFPCPPFCRSSPLLFHSIHSLVPSITLHFSFSLSPPRPPDPLPLTPPWGNMPFTVSAATLVSTEVPAPLRSPASPPPPSFFASEAGETLVRGGGG